jgi:hypothetical protein
MMLKDTATQIVAMLVLAVALVVVLAQEEASFTAQEALPTASRQPENPDT